MELIVDKVFSKLALPFWIITVGVISFAGMFFYRSYLETKKLKLEIEEMENAKQLIP